MLSDLSVLLPTADLASAFLLFAYVLSAYLLTAYWLSASSSSRHRRTGIGDGRTGGEGRRETTGFPAPHAATSAASAAYALTRAARGSLSLGTSAGR